MAAWLQGKVVEKKQWCTDLFSLKISTSPVSFISGQFIRVALEIEGSLLARPYSLVNTPQEPLLEIHFNNVADGLLSPHLAELVEGDSIQVSERANGLLTLDEIPDAQHLWLFATGTGIGPFLSILKNPETWQRFKKIVLAYSAKSLEKLAYREELELLQSRHPVQFCFIPFVTREETPDAINSRITTSLEKGELEKHAGLKILKDSSHIMLCGNSIMVSDVASLLEKRGLRRHKRSEPGHIAIEKYY